MKTRVEFVVTIDKAWANDDKEIDFILPKGVTDFIVTEYDGCESLYYVKDGKIYDEDHKLAGDLYNVIKTTETRK